MKHKTTPKKIRAEVYAMYDGHCAYCGKPIEMKDMQVDHVEALWFHNGKDDISNYLPACRMCNFYKGAATIEGFRKNLSSLYTSLERMFIYRLAKQYGIVEEHHKEIKFFFETHEKRKQMEREDSSITWLTKKNTHEMPKPENI